MTALGVTSFCFVLAAAPLWADSLPRCGDCHVKQQDQPFPAEHPVIGTPEEAQYKRIAELVKGAATSNFLAAQHVNQGIFCSRCHQHDFEIGTEVGNEVCLSCHDSYEQLAVLTEHPTVKSQNPHRSHLGEIDCVVCHHGHMESASYCLQCHTNFDMPIPADGR